MKATNLFKALAFSVLTLVSALSTEVKAQDNFITNDEVKNNLVVSRTIYKLDGNYLHNHLRYEFAYDEQNRLICKTANKWDGTSDKWEPYFQMTYRYEAGEIIMNYARWNESNHSYSKDMQQSVYALDEDNTPVVCQTVDKTVSMAEHK